MPTKSHLLSSVQELIETEKYQAVVGLLDDQTLSTMDSAELYTERGRAYVNLLQLERALTDFNKAIELDPAYPNAYFGRSEVWYKMELFEKALDDCNNALIIKPTYYQAYNSRGIILTALKKYDEAFDSYNTCLLIKPSYYKAYNNRATLYYEIKEYEQAAADCHTSIGLNAQNPVAYNILGLIAFTQQDFDLALANFNKAIEYKPNYVFAHTNRVKLLAGIKKYDEALRYANQAIKINDRIATFYNSRANILADIGQFDKAIEDYTTAIEIDPKFYLGYHNRGYLFYKLKDYKKALDDFNSSYKIRPTQNTRLMIDRAKANLGEIVEQNKSNPDSPFYLIIKDIEGINDIDGQEILKEFDNIFESVNKIRHHASNSIEGKVAHYTTLKVADLLVSTKKSKLRYYNAVHMNDPEEGKILIELMDDKGIQNAFEKAKTKEETNIYLGSFLPSLQHEDELVMWRTYGKDENKNDATGCSIVLDTAFFDGDRSYFNQELRDNTQENSQALYRVLYFDKRSQKFANDTECKIETDIFHFKNALKQLLKLKNETEDSKKNRVIDKIVYVFVSELRYFFKSADYSFENELRVIEFASPESDRVIIDPNDSRLPKRVFIESNKLVQQYINKIILGPKVQYQNQWIYLDILMKKQGFQIDVVPSTCKFQ